MGNSDYYERLKSTLKNVRSYSHYFSSNCPLHDDHSPSLLVYANRFVCMACRQHGPLLKLLRAVERQPGYTQSHYKTLDELSPLHIPNMDKEELADLAHDTLVAFPNQATYLFQRGIADRIEPNRLGWYDGWYTIPLYNPHDDFVGLIARAGPELQEKTGWRYVPFQSPTLYIPDYSLIQRSSKLYVVFGMFDALALTTLRLPCVTGTHGKNFDPAWLDKFRMPIYVIPDKGEEFEGQMLVANLGWRGKLLDINWPEGCKDPADILEKKLTQPFLAQL